MSFRTVRNNRLKVASPAHALLKNHSGCMYFPNHRHLLINGIIYFQKRGGLFFEKIRMFLQTHECRVRLVDLYNPILFSAVFTVALLIGLLFDERLGKTKGLEFRVHFHQL